MATVEENSVPKRDGFKKSRGRLWMLVGLAVVGIVCFLLFDAATKEPTVDGMPFYAATHYLWFDRVVSFAFLGGMGFNALAYYMATGSQYPRTDAGGAMQIGFSLQGLAGICFMARLAAIGLA